MSASIGTPPSTPPTTPGDDGPDILADEEPMHHRSDLLGIFAHHKVAANLLMIILLLAGAFALDRLNVQFFPTFELEIVSVQVTWTGASAEDVEDGITIPLEQRLRSADNLKDMTSTSSQGISAITLEFQEGSDPLLALDQVRRFVDEFRNLPQDAEKPEIALVTRYEQVARLLVTGLEDPGELRALAPAHGERAARARHRQGRDQRSA